MEEMSVYETEDQNFNCWCIVEILGHRKIAGRVTETEIAGKGFLRIDVPAVPDQKQKGFTAIFGTGSIYSITPTTEEIVTAFVRQNVDVPISRYDVSLPELLSETDEISF